MLFSKRHLLSFFLIAWLLTACSVTFITGYDAVVDNTVTKMKTDYNLHFIRLRRALQDDDPLNQRFENYQDYYDHLEVDLIILQGRSQHLGEKSGLVKKQINGLDSTMRAFEALHRSGMQDRPNDDRRDLLNGINSSFDAVIYLQAELRTAGKIKENP